MHKQVFTFGFLLLLAILAMPSLLNAEDVQKECVPCRAGQDLVFDSALIAPKPVDQASVEQAFLIGQDYTMLGQQGDLVRFIIRDGRLLGGEGTFSFNVKTYQIILEKAGNRTDQPLVVFADAAGNGQVRVQTVGGGCYYRFQGSTRCVGHTLYGYFCLSGSWYCYIFGTCRWIPIGSC